MADFTKPVYYSWDVLMSSSKRELLDLYKFHNNNKEKVYFLNEEGKWLLTAKGEAVLVKD